MKRLFPFVFLAASATAALAQEAGWIGVTVDDEKDRGAIIRRVEPDSPAAKAGLREGDIVTEFNKEDVIGVLQLTRMVRETPAGRTVEVKVRRNSKEQTFQVGVERFPRINRPARQPGAITIPFPTIRLPEIRFPDIDVTSSVSQSGIRVQRLTDQLRDFFGVFTDDGVLVSSVDANSPGDKAGVKAGDIITSINGRVVRNPAGFQREMRAAGGRITLKMIRDKKEQEISLP